MAPFSFLTLAFSGRPAPKKQPFAKQLVQPECQIRHLILNPRRQRSDHIRPVSRSFPGNRLSPLSISVKSGQLAVYFMTIITH